MAGSVTFPSAQASAIITLAATGFPCLSYIGGLGWWIPQFKGDGIFHHGSLGLPHRVGCYPELLEIDLEIFELLGIDLEVFELLEIDRGARCVEWANAESTALSGGAWSAIRNVAVVL